MNLQSTMTIPDEVKQAREAATATGNKLGAMSAAEGSISDVLRQKIIEAYQNNEDITVPLDAATQTYLNAPQAAREKYQNIFNPFQRENLVSQYQGNAALPMLSLSNIYGNRVGRIDDTIGAGTRAYSASVEAARNTAEMATQNYKNLLDEYVTGEQLGLDREKFEYSKLQDSRSGSGTGIPGVTTADQNTAETWDELVNIRDSNGNLIRTRSADEVWTMINRDQGALSVSGVDVNALWKWQKQMKDTEVSNSPQTNSINYTQKGMDFLKQLLKPSTVNGMELPKYL